MPPTLTFLFCTAEEHPTHRADIRVLFGKYLPMFGIHTDLVAVAAGGAPGAQWPAGQCFVRRPGSRIGAKLADLIQTLSLLRRSSQGYDGVIVRDKPILGIIGLLAARLAGIPFIYWMSFPFPEVVLRIAHNADGNASPLRRVYGRLRGTLGSLLLYRVIVPRADHLFVQSDVMHRELIGKGLRHDRVTPVPMGVDLEALPPRAGAPSGEFENRRIAVYLGTLDRVRNPEIMVDAAMTVARAIPGFLLLVIGETDEPRDKGWLARYAEEKGAGHCVRFTGRVPFEQALAYARMAEVGLSPFPRNELLESASPTKAVEYMALGIPVVCNDQPDQAEVIRQSGAGFCVELSGKGFADAILACMNDREASRRMGEAGQAYVKAHRSYRALASGVADQLVQVAASRSVRPRVRPEGS